MHKLARIGVVIGVVLAHVAGLAIGAQWLGPARDLPAPESPDPSALVMLLAVAALDTALIGAWLARAYERGWKLWLEAMLVFYGIKTFSSQLEVWYFVPRDVVPPGMLGGLFAMTLPLAIAWTGLMVLAYGRSARPPEPTPSSLRSGSSLALRIGIAGAIVYPLLFFVFGYWVAWQNPTLRAYYGGPEVALGFVEHFAALFSGDPWVIPFEMMRGLLWIAIGWPVLARTRGPWWVGGLLFALMLAIVQNDMHLLQNPLMPDEVRFRHLIETSTSNFLFGLITALLLRRVND